MDRTRNGEGGMICKFGRCYSPIACEGFGYCRERNADRTVLALLREARPYVASAQCDEDTETHNFVDGLLRDIDAALAQAGGDTNCQG
jgi:hypothetical protein